jgi:voltage-dependent potassium channel beta subunit
MNYRRLGRSGVRVSEISLGGWLTHGRTLDDSATENLVRLAFDRGINFFDTADVYHNGAAETALGKAIHGIRRDDLFLATKCYFPMTDLPNDQGLSRKHIFESVHHSLKRLGTDYVDLFQFHRFDAYCPMDESVRAIDDLVRQGKVLYWGVSEWSGDQIRLAHHIAREFNCHFPVSNQPSYSLLNRKIDQHVIPTSQELGVGQVVFSPLAQGVLTGKYKPGEAPPAGSRAADPTSNQFITGMLTDETLSRVQTLGKWAEGKGLTLVQVALGWCLRQPNVSSVIIGATSAAQLEANIAASGVTLSAAEWAEAEAILDGTAHG